MAVGSSPRYPSIQRCSEVSYKEKKSIRRKKRDTEMEHRPVLLTNCGQRICKKCFNKRKNKICEQYNCGKVKNNDEFDNFQIMAVIGARNDVEMTKALDCVICFEEHNLGVNRPMALNYSGHVICSSCMGDVLKCYQCRKSFFQLCSNEKETLIKLLE